MSRILLENDEPQALSCTSITYSEDESAMASPQALSCLSATYTEGRASLAGVMSGGFLTVIIG